MGIIIYTDGGCSGNPGPGGWAYVILRGGTDGEILEERSGGERATTNNRMELTAAIRALERLEALEGQYGYIAGETELYTDSQYLQKGMNEWLPAWKRKNWHTGGKTPVKNRDLWERLDALAARRAVSWRWVRGHAGNAYNERCDTLTQEAIRAQTA